MQFVIDKAKAEAPTALLVAGVVGVVAAGVLACRATLKLKPVIETAENELADIHNEETDAEAPVDEADITKEKAKVYFRTGTKLAKLYGPAVSLGAASIFMIVASHNIMESRNAALIGLYEATAASFRQYRNRVKEKLGEEEEHILRYGVEKDSVEKEYTDSAGRKRKGKQDISVFDPNSISRYAVIFDENSTQWESSPEYNKAFVIGIQNTCNDLLHANGYLFLNTVYRMLGLPETTEGQLVGWMMGKGDDFVDFGIYNDAYSRDAKHKFINGCEPSILLDFNVDGVIYKNI